ncbi:MAG: SDR family oxidoreductase [Patescibacteria group bacterium]
MIQLLESAPKRVFFTGATGGVGSSLLFELLSQGFHITCLVRPQKGMSGYDRLKGQLGVIPQNLSIVEGDVTLPLCGIPSHDRERLKGNIDLILHGAGEIGFDERNAEKTYRVNHGGTVNVLGLAHFLDVQDFRHISTAYVAGDSKVFKEGDLRVGQFLRNPYEESKCLAEEEIHYWAAKGGKNYMIFRPSIVVGSSETGITTTFDAYYGFLYFLYRMWKKWVETTRLFSLPLYIDCSTSSTLNLVTSNWSNKLMAQLLKCSPDGKTYHIVDETPKPILWVTSESLKYLGITGVHLGKQNPLDSDDAKKVQGRFDRFIGRPFGPYIVHEARFLTGNARATLGKHYAEAPEITGELLQRLLAFAQKKWDQEILLTTETMSAEVA